MDLVLRFDVFWTEVLRMVNIGQRCQKLALHERKRAKISNPYLNAHLHININLHIHFQENPSNSLGGVAITNFFS